MPDLSELNAIHSPSGEKCGLPSTAGVLVNLRASPPVLGTIQRSPPYSKAICELLMAGCLNIRVPCAFTDHWIENRRTVNKVFVIVERGSMLLVLVSRCEDYRI
jgi:hypothetical protein